MGYLDQDRKTLAWNLIRDPHVLIEVFKECLVDLNNGGNGDLRYFGRWVKLSRIHDAVELARDHSPAIARYWHDAEARRAPRITDAMHYLNEPIGSADEQLMHWESFLEEYSALFADHLIVSNYMNRSSPEEKSSVNGKPPWSGDTTSSPVNMVTPDQVALLLSRYGKTLSGKTLKNTYKAGWGPADGKEGNAELFDWNRIQPIVEEQFKVKFSG